MLRRTRSILLTAGLVAPVLVLAGHSAAGAVDQDLVISATNGAPGTTITASSASCTSDYDDDFERYLQVQLIAGTAPDEVLVGIATGIGDRPATIVIPDWVDPDAPAVIEASCRSFSWSGDDVEERIDPYDPVAFDIEPGVGPSVQTRSISRTEVMARQGLSVSANGCTVGGYGGVVAFPGSDLSGRTFDQPVAEGDALVEGGSFEADMILSNASTDWYSSILEDGASFADGLIEIPNDLAPGPYALVTYCGDGETTLLYEPALIQITGVAPTGDLDLTSPADSRAVTLAGGSCTATVNAEFTTFDLRDWFDDVVYVEPDQRARFDRSDAGAVPAFAAPTARRSALDRVLDENDVTSRDVTPDADGTWTIDDSVSFDHGLVEAAAVCGDPLGDGFVYDPQLVEVRAAVEAPTTTTPITPTPTVPGSPPAATAVPGVPNYAG